MTSSQVRFAARFALRNSVGIIVTTIVLVPLFSIINRLFDGTWYVNWRLMASVSAVLTFLIFAFFFAAQLLESSSEESRERQSQLFFPGVMWVRGLYLMSIVMGLGLMAGTYKEGDPWWDVMIPIVFVFLGFFAWPRAIEISGNEIRQHRIYFGYKRISFGEIERVASDPSRNETIIFGKNGERIVHTMMHAQRERFNQQLESSTGKCIYSVGDLGGTL
jgi:hypothetical protein